jgi:hypothetical protein
MRQRGTPVAIGADPHHDAGLLRHLARRLPLIQEGVLRGLHNGLRHRRRAEVQAPAGHRDAARP